MGRLVEERGLWHHTDPGLSPPLPLTGSALALSQHVTSLCLFFFKTSGHPRASNLCPGNQVSLTFHVYKRELSTPGSQEERPVPTVSDVPKPPLIVVAQGRQGTGGKNYTQLPRPGDFCSEANK